MKTRYKIIIMIITVSFIGIFLLEILDNFTGKLIHDMNKSNSIKNYKTLETTCNDSNGKPNGECFINAFNECKSAKIKQMSSTIEGDPIFYYATIMPKDSCNIHFEMDISQDKWKGIATKDVIQKTCTGAQLDKYAINLQCDNEQYEIPLR